jgi:hypothetical protein
MIPAKSLVVCGCLLAAAAAGRAETALPETDSPARQDRTVQDSATALVWQQNTADTNGDGKITAAAHPEGDKMSWQQAMNYCAGLSYAGTDDWRLPESTELDTLVDVARSYPAILPAYQAESDGYWAATISPDVKGEAQYVHFNYGTDSTRSKTKKLFVRCVRKAQ